MKSDCVFWLLSGESSVYCWGSRILGLFIPFKIALGSLSENPPTAGLFPYLLRHWVVRLWLKAVGDTGSVPVQVTDFSELTVVCYFC